MAPGPAGGMETWSRAFVLVVCMCVGQSTVSDATVTYVGLEQCGHEAFGACGWSASGGGLS